jgi:hypothetical protein
MRYQRHHWWGEMVAAVATHEEWLQTMIGPA